MRSVNNGKCTLCVSVPSEDVSYKWCDAGGETAYDQLALGKDVVKMVYRPVEVVNNTTFQVACHSAFMASSKTPPYPWLEQAAHVFYEVEGCDMITHVFTPGGGIAHLPPGLMEHLGFEP